MSRRAWWKATVLLWDLLLPAAVGAVIVVSIWTHLINRCRGWGNWDPSGHLMYALDAFFVGGKHAVSPSVYGPVTYQWTGLFFQFMTPDRRAAELSILALFIPLAILVYQLGRRFGGRGAGMVCLFLTLFNCHVLILSAEYLLDLPLMVMVVAMYLAFERSDGFRHRRATMVLAIIIAVGLLTKRSFAYFMLPPVLVFVAHLYRSVRNPLVSTAVLLACGGVLWFLASGRVRVNEELFIRFWYLHIIAVALAGMALYFALGYLASLRMVARQIRDGRAFLRARNGMVALGMGGAWALPWYLHHYQGLVDDLQYNLGKTFDVVEALRHLVDFFPDQWIGAGAMLCVGLLCLPWSRHRMLLLSMAIGTIVAGVVLALTTDLQTRFIIPLLPLVAVVATWYLGRFRILSIVVALGLIAAQVPYMSQTRADCMGEEFPWTTCRLMIPDAQWAQELIEIGNEGTQCDISTRVVKLFHELRSLEDGPLIGCISEGQESEQRMRLGFNTPGFSCGVIGGMLARPGVPTESHRSLYFGSGPGKDDPFTYMADNGLSAAFFLYTGHRGQNLDGVLGQLTTDEYEAEAVRFLSLLDEYGLHVLQIRRRNPDRPRRPSEGCLQLPRREMSCPRATLKHAG